MVLSARQVFPAGYFFSFAIAGFDGSISVALQRKKDEREEHALRGISLAL